MSKIKVKCIKPVLDCTVGKVYDVQWMTKGVTLKFYDDENDPRYLNLAHKRAKLSKHMRLLLVPNVSTVFTTDYPNWYDNGKEIILDKGGVEELATLDIYDVGYNGSYEYPIFNITLNSNNNSVDLSDYDQWSILQ